MVRTPKRPANSQTLDKFFTPAARNSIPVDSAESDCPLSKRAKAEGLTQSSLPLAATDSTSNGAGDVSSSSAAESLTPEQKSRIDANKAAALAKLAAKNVQLTAPSVLSSSSEFVLLDAPLDDSWRQALQGEFRKDYFKKLHAFLEGELQAGVVVYPPSRLIFNSLNLCTLPNIKVVILGQDPYHGPNQAHGLCFSVQKGVPAPPSLVNIYQELQADIQGFQAPKHGCLEAWAQRGVLLLNALLTVRAKQPMSHASKGWEPFTDAIISYINTHCKGVVFLLWGAPAQKKGSKIDKSKHLVLTAVHPSPLSAHRGWFGCKHFSKANAYLQKNGKQTVDWSLTEDS